jgi:hypothetical protein
VTYRKHTTIAEVLAVLRLHALADVADRILMCRCGRWFNEPDLFSTHLLTEAQAQLTAPHRPGAEITREVLAQVAEIHRSAPDGEKTRRVAEFLGVSTRSAGTYVSRARKAGLITPPGAGRAA